MMREPDRHRWFFRKRCTHAWRTEGRSHVDGVTWLLQFCDLCKQMRIQRSKESQR